MISVPPKGCENPRAWWMGYYDGYDALQQAETKNQSYLQGYEQGRTDMIKDREDFDRNGSSNA